MSEAREVLERGLLYAPSNVWLRGRLTAVYGRLGSRDEVLRRLDGLESESLERYVPSLIRGLAQAAAGNLDLAFPLLDAAIDEQQIWTLPFLILPLFRDLLRADPRYRGLRRKLNLPDFPVTAAAV